MARFSKLRRRTRGLAAIEFALLFPLFFFMFYGLVCWAFIFMLQESMSFAAQSAARAAIAAKIEEVTAAAHLENARSLARAEAGRVLDWMPAEWKSHVLGSDNEKVQVEITSDADAYWIRVTASYADFGAQPLLPQLALPGGVKFPPVPDRLVGQAILRL